MNRDSYGIDDDNVVECTSCFHQCTWLLCKTRKCILLKKIIKTHGDIGKNCEIKCGKSRGLFIEMMCSVFKKLEETSLKEIIEIELEVKLPELLGYVKIEPDLLTRLQIKLLDILKNIKVLSFIRVTRAQNFLKVEVEKGKIANKANKGQNGPKEVSKA